MWNCLHIELSVNLTEPWVALLEDIAKLVQLPLANVHTAPSSDPLIEAHKTAHFEIRRDANVCPTFRFPLRNCWTKYDRA